jgi:hypothetical protein
MEHNDIYSIVERLAILEGRITPATVKHGLNSQQRSVPQMPALFRPKTQKILGGDPSAKNPMSGYAVGGCEESAMAEDVLGKVKKSFNDYLKSLEDEIRQDTDLKPKTHDDTDLKHRQPDTGGLRPRDITPAVRVVEMANGEACEIHGNDDEGYEIRHGDRTLPTRFNDIKHAEMALEMYNARLHARHPHLAQAVAGHDDDDYLEEK